VGGETYPVGSLKKANISHWTSHVRFTTAVYLPETRLLRREIAGKYAIKIVIKHAHSWK
jgi:hypothetical protein